MKDSKRPLGHMWAIVWKDVMLERRTRQSVGAMVVFAVAAVITFNFALFDKLDGVRNVSVGLLWTILWLAGTLGINRSFAAETESRALDALLIAPVERSTIFFGKLGGLYLSLLIVVAVLVGMFTIFFNLPFYKFGVLLFLLLGTLGYVAAGVFVGSITAQTKSSYLLTPILILPLTLPLIWASAVGSAQFFQAQVAWEAVRINLGLVILYDLLMFGAGAFFYNYVLDE